MKKRARSKILSLVMAAAMLCSLLSVVTVYAEGSGEPPPSAGGVVTAFDPLAEDGAARNVPAGTALSGLNLPDTLGAKIGGVSGSVSGVTWRSAPEYNGGTPDTYIFTAVLPQGYTLGEGVNAPVITVEVTAAISSPLTFP